MKLSGMVHRSGDAKFDEIVGKISNELTPLLFDRLDESGLIGSKLRDAALSASASIMISAGTAIVSAARNEQERLAFLHAFTNNVANLTTLAVQIAATIARGDVDETDHVGCSCVDCVMSMVTLARGPDA